MCDDVAALLVSRQQLRQGEGVWTMDLSTSVWRKSTLSGANGCVEVAIHADGVALRDAKDGSGPILVFSRGEWEAFIGGVRAGEFDLEA
jgi:Domain of unknown function (DUF397)